MGDMVNLVGIERSFRNMRVLVTGDTGFKGSWLSLWLHSLGAHVLGYALPPERSNDHFNLLNLQNLIEHVDGDITNLDFLQQTVNRFEPEVIFHLAAQPLVRLSYEKPALTFDTNVTGSANVLESARNCPSLRCLVYVTSDKCYRNKEWVWGYRENDELGGHDPYSASKAAAEMVFASYQDSFFSKRPNFGAAAVRAGNVIGGGDWALDRIVPDAIRSLAAGVPISLRNPGSTRPWQHVLDPLSGYMLIAARLLDEPNKFDGAWNFGPGPDSICTVGDLAGKIVQSWGEGSLKSVEQINAPHEARLLYLNCDKAHQLLHWRPRWEVEQAVAETVSWYKAILAGQSAMNVSLEQISRYVRMK